ncbi:acyl-CoA synthetase (AMP-forming)/AMP-acid ligase II [Archangium gephyra]|uniref:Acyl-CoA synthetase (AMP-forming)/AMP-acid ligase II n=1 Tax=Archangium gephyra TaxID=48 RepID=A0ABX9JZ18_9BACT|nr:fatty acyl-AMP ligase [Archangium gephyra]REG29770.1 acyl-CoA synthetase (AMP-forming)/AMP-acid ligase II [Archangium gephyra]
MVSDCISGATSLAHILHRRAGRHPERRALTFLVRGTEQHKAYSFAALDQRARTIAALLKAHGMEGERALLLYPQGAEYVESFLGCLYAGTVAVPAYPPDPTRLERTLGRLLGIIADCRPKVVLATKEIRDLAAAFAAQVPGLGELKWLATDDEDLGVVPLASPADARSEQLAFLQYTSGSTSSPKGVMVSHGNLLANLAHIRGSVELGEDSCSVTWLPSFHDMGLVDGLLEGFYSGYPVYLMSPADFLKHPLRWLQAVTAFRVTHSGGPNFGYELCVRKATPEALSALDLSSWRSAYCGAEPVRAGTMRRFLETFSPRGFSASALFPVFGLAETTLKAPGRQGRGVVTLSVDKKALEADQAVPLPTGDAQATELVSCGESEEGYGLAIVEPESRERLPDGRVGEIWVYGPSVAQGYWRKPELSEETFHARIRGEDSREWLRTGDLGFLRDGLLYITGRRKDLIIIGGRNHYPQDIEWTVEAALPEVRPGCGAAFSVDVDGEERLVVVAEVDTRRQQGGESLDLQAAAATVRQAINEAYQLRLHELVFLKPGSVPKTSSGKIQRQAARRAYLERGLQRVTEEAA